MTLQLQAGLTFATVACVLAVAGTVATYSSAAVVEVRADPSLHEGPCKRSVPQECPDVMLVVAAEPGERNILTLVRDNDDVVISDAGAALRAGAGCAATVGGGVRCTRPDGPFEMGARVRVDAADGDDRIVAPDLTFGGGDVFLGGMGNDVITASGAMAGGLGDDVLTGVGLDAIVDGGEGHDIIKSIDTPLRLPRFGAAPNDVALFGGPGNDDIRGGRGHVHIEGGAGRDFVRAGNGQSWIYGGPDDDRLYGGSTYAYIKGEEGDDRIVGSPWEDRLRGGPGADQILGLHGVDDVRGDGGRDRIRVFDSVRDVVDCGAGVDLVVGDRIDARTSCERFRRGKGRPSHPPTALDE